MHFYKFILAAVGISCAVASPVPQSNNDELESCNSDCKSTYDTCINAAAKGRTVNYQGCLAERTVDYDAGEAGGVGARLGAGAGLGFGAGAGAGAGLGAGAGAGAAA